MHGTSTLINSEVTNISSLGFWILVNNQEFFIAFNEYPKFKEIPVKDIFDVQMLSPEQFYWEKHDIDIELSALKNPESFPLFYK